MTRAAPYCLWGACRIPPDHIQYQGLSSQGIDPSGPVQQQSRMSQTCMQHESGRTRWLAGSGSVFVSGREWYAIGRVSITTNLRVTKKDLFCPNTSLLRFLLYKQASPICALYLSGFLANMGPDNTAQFHTSIMVSLARAAVHAKSWR